MNIAEVRAFLKNGSLRSSVVSSEAQYKQFQRDSKNRQWIYLILWNQNPLVFSWGTSSNKGTRLRYSSLFNSKLSGKYDRRVDYLMLKQIYGEPVVEMFEYPFKATIREKQLKDRFGQLHCWFGLTGHDRREIAKTIIASFKKTQHWMNCSESDRKDFDEYLTDVFFANRSDPATGHSFAWGDSLNSSFLNRIDKKHLKPALERVLKVHFSTRTRSKISLVQSVALEPTTGASTTGQRKLSTIEKAKIARELTEKRESKRAIASVLGVSEARVDQYLKRNSHPASCPSCRGQGVNIVSATNSPTKRKEEKPICDRAKAA